MARKHMMQLFPWLMPARRRERLFCFYLRMRLDGNRYAVTRSGELLPYRIFETSCPLYNRETGFDMIYQENKVFNLKLAVMTLDRLLIKPNETFSFWRATRYADRVTPYKDGLTVLYGKLTTAPGGGLCQLSDLLFWMFLHSPLTIVERHGHRVKDFPDPPSDAPAGVDATVSEGWLDLKVKNDTDESFQINITFDPDCITGRLLAGRDTGVSYEIGSGQPLYSRRDGSVFEEVDVGRNVISTSSGRSISSTLLYKNICEIGYQLPAGTQIAKRDQEEGKRMKQLAVAVLFGAVRLNTVYLLRLPIQS